MSRRPCLEVTVLVRPFVLTPGVLSANTERDVSQANERVNLM
jgi:hypothetical protein